jgi:hypothetical protein
MAKGYKTANGKLVDMDGLRLKNEDTIALGNMRTNARGDELGPGGKVVKTRNERMNENYKLHSMVPKDDLVHDTLDMAMENAVPQQTGIESQEMTPDLVTPVTQEETPKVTTSSKKSNFGTVKSTNTDTVLSVPAAKKPRGGLAASVAKPDANQTSVIPTKIKRI